MSIPTPPRVTGKPEIDVPSLVEWAWSLYRELIIQDPATQRLNRIAEIPPLDTGTATTTDVAEKINAVITAAAEE